MHAREKKLPASHSSQVTVRMFHYRQFRATRRLKFFTAAMGMAGSGDLPPAINLLPAKKAPS